VVDVDGLDRYQSVFHPVLSSCVGCFLLPTLANQVAKCNYVSVEIRDFPRDACPVGAALDHLGDRWTLLVLREAFFGVRRFEELRRNTGAAKNILADRLARLVEAGILRRERYSERPPRDEYRLTDKGRDLYPVIVTLAQWGTKWGDLQLGAAVELQHRACGAIVQPTLTCPDCGEPVEARDMRALPGPAMLRLAGGLDEGA
jgi:DNA-binding HxlR family transcriptional regulator